MLVQAGGGETIKDLVTFLLGRALENLQVLEHLRVDLDLVVEADGILTEEVEDDGLWWAQGDVLELEGTAADGVCLVFTLLVTSTESKLIDQIHSSGALSLSHDF